MVSALPAEMPSLERLQQKLGGQADRRRGLAGPRRREGWSTPFIEKLGLDKVKVYLDPKSEVGKAFGVRGLPTSIVLDAEGREVGRVEGAADWDSDKMLSRCSTPLRLKEAVKPAGAPLSTSRRKRPPRSRPSGSIACSMPSRPASRPAPGPCCNAASAPAIEFERHQRIVGAVDQQHRRARAQFAGQQLRGDQPPGIAENTGQ